jgi:hypothetical protein
MTGGELSYVHLTAVSAILFTLKKSWATICESLTRIFRTLKGEEATHQSNLKARERERERLVQEARVRTSKPTGILYTDEAKRKNQEIVDKYNAEKRAKEVVPAPAPGASENGYNSNATVPNTQEGGSRKKRRNRH